MSITKVRPFFKKILTELEYKEHEDAFNFANIASSQIDRGFHITSGQITPVKQSQMLVEMTFETTVRLFFHGYTNPYEALESVILDEEEVIKKALSVKCNALEDIKLTSLVSCNREQLGESNDNIIVSTLIFNSLVMVQPY